MKNYGNNCTRYDFVKGVEPSYYLPHCTHTVQRQVLFACVWCYQCTNEALVWIIIINALNTSEGTHVYVMIFSEHWRNYFLKFGLFIQESVECCKCKVKKMKMRAKRVIIGLTTLCPGVEPSYRIC